MRCNPQPEFKGLRPSHHCSGNGLWSQLASLLPCDHQGLSEGPGGPAEPPPPSDLLDDFLLGDGRLRDGRGGLDDGGDGSRQKLVGLGP